MPEVEPVATRSDADKTPEELRAELTAVKKDLAAKVAELDRLKTNLAQMSAAWRLLFKQLG